MAKNSISRISNAFTTGGGGVNFEQQIQAMFLLSLLVDGFCPAMNESTKRVCFQAKHLGYDVDDLVVFTFRNRNEGKMLCQVKHSITATSKNHTFQEVISAAWSDFNKDTFDKENDQISTFVLKNSADSLLGTSLCDMDEEFILRILTGIPFSMGMLNAIEKLLSNDSEYWECARMPFLCSANKAEELKLIADKLIACKRYVTATNIIGRSDFDSIISAEYIYKLLKLAGTEESVGSETLDDYAVQKIISWFQTQECIDLNARSDIEFIYLPVIGD